MPIGKTTPAKGVRRINRNQDTKQGLAQLISNARALLQGLPTRLASELRGADQCALYTLSISIKHAIMDELSQQDLNIDAIIELDPAD